MKRDMDLIRRIMMQIEERETWNRPFDVEIEGRDKYEVTYHLKLLSDNGLIEAMNASSHDGPEYLPKGLTWEGHEFLDNAKNETVWQQAKKRISEGGGSASFEVIKALLSRLAMKAFIGDHAQPFG